MSKNYYSKLCGVYDTISETIEFTGIEESLGAFTRKTIPIFQNQIPLNDLKIVELGEINKFTGEIKPIDKIKFYEWQELYKFNITAKAVENETETTKTEEADKQ